MYKMHNFTYSKLFKYLQLFLAKLILNICKHTMHYKNIRARNVILQENAFNPKILISIKVHRYIIHKIYYTIKYNKKLYIQLKQFFC